MFDILPSFRDAPLRYKVSILCSVLVSGAITAATFWMQYTANELQKGDNTIKVIITGQEDVIRNAKANLFELRIGPVLSVPGQMAAYQGIAPLIGYLELVGTCYTEGLCLRGAILEHFCQDVSTIAGLFETGGLSELPQNPLSGKKSFQTLRRDCPTVKGE